MLQGSRWIRDIPAEHARRRSTPQGCTHVIPHTLAFPTVKRRAAAVFDLDLSVQPRALLLWCAPMCVNKKRSSVYNTSTLLPPHPPTLRADRMQGADLVCS